MSQYPNIQPHGLTRGIGIGIGMGIGIFNDNVVNNYTRLGCDEKARMHLNGLVEPWGHVAQIQRDSMA